MNRVVIKVYIEPGCDDIPLPEYQTTGSAGLDLPAAVDGPIIIEPGCVKLISTGIRLAIPNGYEAQVRPRSGLALKHGIGILNAPGTIDSDYRGVVCVVLFNISDKPFTVERGDRIAQMVIARVEHAVFEISENLDATERESGGFGSTGS